MEIDEVVTVSIPSKKKQLTKRKFNDEYKSLNVCPGIFEEIRKKCKEIMSEEYYAGCFKISEKIRSQKSSNETLAIHLLCEINDCDCEEIHNSIKKLIKEAHFISLNANSNITVKYIVRNIVDSLSGYNKFDDNDEEDDSSMCTSKKRFKMHYYTLWKLRKLCKEQNIRPLIVLSLVDLTFVSNDIINVMRELREAKDFLNVVLILGMPKSPTAFFTMIPDDVLQYYTICIHKFPPSTKILDKIVEKIFVGNNNSFFIHGSILADIFFSFTSIKSFIQAIKGCIVNHFYDNDESLLCCAKEDIYENVKRLQNSDIDDILKLNSLMSNNSKEIIKSIKNSPRRKNELSKHLNELHDRINRFNLTVRCLHACLQLYAEMSEDTTDGNAISMKWLYCEAMKGKISFIKDHVEHCDKLRFITQQMKCISVIINILSSSEDECVIKIVNKLRQFENVIKSLKQSKPVIKNDLKNAMDFKSDINTEMSTPTTNLQRNLKLESTTPSSLLSELKLESSTPSSLLSELKLEPSTPSSRNKSVSYCTPSSSHRFGRSSTTGSRNDFMQVLHNSPHRNKNVSKLVEIRQSLSEFLIKEFFIPFLESPVHYPFNEILIYQPSYYESGNIVGKIDHKGMVEKALRNPGHILHCKCCDHGKKASSWPDICSSYQVFTEYGLEINLYSWLQGFNSLINEDETTNDEEESIQPNSYFRFLQTIKEFQMFGFIKPLKKKVDHVKKLKI